MNVNAKWGLELKVEIVFCLYFGETLNGSRPHYRLITKNRRGSIGFIQNFHYFFMILNTLNFILDFKLTIFFKV